MGSSYALTVPGPYPLMFVPLTLGTPISVSLFTIETTLHLRDLGYQGKPPLREHMAIPTSEALERTHVR